MSIEKNTREITAMTTVRYRKYAEASISKNMRKMIIVYLIACKMYIRPS